MTTDRLGNWVAGWRSQDSLGGTIGTDWDVLVSGSVNAGATWTAPAALNTNASTDSGGDYAPQITTNGAGNWVAVWGSDDSLGGTIGTDDDIFVSRSADSGAYRTAPVPLNANAGTDSGGDYVPHVATDGAGNWIVTWDSFDSLGGTIGGDFDVLVSRSADAARPGPRPRLLNATAGTDSGNDFGSQITTDGAGNWIAAWHSDDTLGGTIGTDADILYATFSEFSGTTAMPRCQLSDALGRRRRPARPRGPTLGANRDTEADGQPSANADGDDISGTPDDEDGVIAARADRVDIRHTTASLTIDLQNADASSNYLDAWIDFNQDGDWDDPGEQIFTSYNLGTTNGTQTLSFTVPQDTGGNIVYGTTYARFRLSTAGGLLPTGLPRRRSGGLPGGGDVVWTA